MDVVSAAVGGRLVEGREACLMVNCNHKGWNGEIIN